jgi:hypothetical protein
MGRVHELHEISRFRKHFFAHRVIRSPISPSAMLALVASLCIQTSIAGMSGATWWKELIRKF